MSSPLKTEQSASACEVQVAADFKNRATQESEFKDPATVKKEAAKFCASPTNRQMMAP